MKIFIPLICVVSLALTEPPVGGGYPSSRSSHDHSHDHDHEHDHSNDFQRSLSQEYGPPSIESARSFQGNDLSKEYLPPNARPANFRSSLSQTYGPPYERSGIFNGNALPNSRSSVASKGRSTMNGFPNTQSGPSQAYGTPVARSGVSQEYGIPSLRSNNARTSSDQYGAPEVRKPSEEYGVPSQRSFGGAPSDKNGPPEFRQSPSSGIHSAKTGEFQQSNSRSTKATSIFGARSSLTDSRYPTAKSSSSDARTISQTYGVPNQRHLSDYQVSSSKGLSQEYGVPANRATNQKNSAFTSSNSAVTSFSPSDSYGAPMARDFMPTDISKEGYSYARNGATEALNEEPASYDFSYKVEDYESGSDFGHMETRKDNRAEGAYFVVLPDGTKQVVEYEADERGFKPRISVQPADFARSAGYDDNAAELARSGDGPY